MKRRKRPFLNFLCCVFAVPTCGMLLGILPRASSLELLRPWLATGALLGVAHLVVRPILRFITAPLGCLTLGLFGFVIDVALLYICAHFVEGFAVASLGYAIVTALIINTICAVVSR